MDDINVILAECPGLGRVRICECNSVHLSIGPVTLNLEPEAFAQVAILVRNAMDQLLEITTTTSLKAANPSRSEVTH